MAATQGLFKFVSGSSDAPEIYSGTPVTVNTFQVLGVVPHLGRDFTPSDGVPGATPVAILSYELWERRFAKDPAVIGRSVPLNGVPTAVIGVMPARFAFSQKQDLWLPIVPTSDVLRRDRPFLMMAVGRIAEGVTTESAVPKSRQSEPAGERVSAPEFGHSKARTSMKGSSAIARQLSTRRCSEPWASCP